MKVAFIEGQKCSRGSTALRDRPAPSASSEGSSVITLQFTLELNIDVAEQEVQAAINAATTYLPRDLPNPPV